MKAKRYSSALLVVLAVGFGGRAQAAPTLITACTTISASGSYKLANDLTYAGVSVCLHVNASNVTIDLDSFTIVGDGGGYGIFTGLVEGFNVRNGTVKNFDYGIYVQGNTMSIERLTLIRNSAAGFTGGSENIAFRDNIVTGNGTGLTVGQGAVVTGNIVNFNTADGISASTGTFVNNTIVSNGGAGLRAACPSAVTGNTLNANTGGNLVLSGTGCSRRLRQHNATP